MKLLIIFVICVVLSSCESTTDHSKGRFLTNDRGTVVGLSRLAEISKGWKSDPSLIFGSSGAGKINSSWTVDFIATTEAGGISPCNELIPVRLTRMDLSTFSVFNSVKNEKNLYKPEKYHEAWFINACGKLREWRVFDDPSYKGDPHTVILWSAG
jgi:hypothetical protein